MNVLIACEFSGRVRDEFNKKGHYSVSCDLLPTEADGEHYQGDVRDILNLGWDLMIAHPPCTHLASSGARWFKYKQVEQADALEFVIALLNAPIPRIAIENPIGVISSKIRKPDQIIQPYHFGHMERKSTCLWLKNLPPLEHETEMGDDVNKLPANKQNPLHWLPPTDDRWKKRSLTYLGIAQAFAKQWG